MTKRIAAIAFIFACTTVAWFILGATIFERTNASGPSLREKVVSLWGAPHEQQPPSASYVVVREKAITGIENGKPYRRTVEERETVSLPLDSSRVGVVLDLDYRQKGLLWYSVYKVAFSGLYGFRNTSSHDEDVRFSLAYPAGHAIYDDLQFSVDGAPLEVANETGAAIAKVRIGAGRTALLRATYRSQGLESWRYKLGGEVAQVRDFVLNVKTDFKNVDFPENALSPTDKRETSDGWDLTWNYRSLVSGFNIGITMPEKLQPGPLAGRISYFAPVSLFFFFFLMLMITTLRGTELHPMNYFFLAAAFFAFHLLLAYLVDHISIHAAFLISSAVSIFLVVSYLRLVTGMRFALAEAASAQFVYLVLFSYAFFFQGFTGLAITIGSIATLFIVMQMTGRIRWAEKFAS